MLVNNLPEITPEYIASITEEELKAAEYQFVDYPAVPYAQHRIVVLLQDVNLNKSIPMFSSPAAAIAFAASHYAPRKLLAEAQARIAALEMLVRCADELLAGSEPVLARIYDGGDTRDWVYKDDWRDEAAKLLEVGDV